MLQDFLIWYSNALEEGGYLLVGFLMALESSIVPLPSEVVIPPAAHIAHTRGRISVMGVVLAGTFDVAQPPLPFRFLPQVLRAVAAIDRKHR